MIFVKRRRSCATIECIIYMIRTDGTVWKLEERIPVKIGDLGSVDVVDLRSLLHYVSGRSDTL